MRRKKYFYLLLSVIMLLPLFNSHPFANSMQKAKYSQIPIILNGEKGWGEGFNLSGNNYFRLYDLASGFWGSNNYFNITWNQNENITEVSTGQNINTYAKQSSKQYTIGSNYSGKFINTRLLVDGEIHNLQALNIDGNNYFRLRDLFDILDFKLGWDGQGNTILFLDSISENALNVEAEYKVVDNTISSFFPRWSSTITTHMIKNKDETISIIEADELITIETYDKDYNLIEKKALNKDLPVFGGFYSGEKYNYIAFGQYNIEENPNKEVIRIVRYDKKFKKIDSVSVKGKESFTTKPFDAGSGKMSEYENTLVFHTSRERFKTEDGLNHQSQLTLIIDTSTMKVTNNLGRFQGNHVSHSFDQYVLFDKDTHVLVDHGDAYPRSIVLNKQSGNSYKSVDLFKIPGQIGANATGVSIGGFEASSTNYMVAMNTVDHSKVKEYTSYGMLGLDKEQRNIIIATIPKDITNIDVVKHITLKQYTGTDKNGSIPKLVKISDDKLMVIWQEYDSNDLLGDLNYVFIDGKGNPIGDTYALKDFKLSESQPILVNGEVIWHVNEKGSRSFYSIPLS